MLHWYKVIKYNQTSENMKLLKYSYIGQLSVMKVMNYFTN